MTNFYTDTKGEVKIMPNYRLQACDFHAYEPQSWLGMPIPGDFHSSGIQGIQEWQFVFPWGSGKLKSGFRVWGLGEFWGVFCFRFEVNLKFLFIEKNYFF